MSELDKAYETADMLKALDLPISKDQLEIIKRLEKKNRKGTQGRLNALLLREMLCQLYETHLKHEAGKSTRRSNFG